MKTSSSNTSEIDSKSESRSGAKWMAIGAAVAAAAVHAYLLKNHYDLRYGEVTGPMICDVSSLLSCSAASASRWAEFLGVPMALWGLLANSAYVTLAAWDPLTEGEGRSSNRTGLLLVALVLVAASIAMGVISAVALTTLCPFCMATYVLSLFTGVGAWLSYRPGLKFLLKPSLLGIVAAFGVSGFILNDQFRASYTGPGGDAMAKAAVQEWVQNPVLEIPETDPLAMGPSRSEAKMTLVEFADFRCIHCKLAVAPIKAFLTNHPDVRLEYYSWPLDGECNTSIKQNNGASCLLARTVWCARTKADKGWLAHERVFARFEEWKTLEAIKAQLPSLASEIGMPSEDLVTCSDSEEAKAAIVKQAQLGTSLNLRGTPAIFANGKSLPAGSQIPVLNSVYSEIR